MRHQSTFVCETTGSLVASPSWEFMQSSRYSRIGDNLLLQSLSWILISLLPLVSFDSLVPVAFLFSAMRACCSVIFVLVYFFVFVFQSFSIFFVLVSFSFSSFFRFRFRFR